MIEAAALTAMISFPVLTFIVWICRWTARDDLETAMAYGWTKQVKAILITRRRWLSKQVLRDAEFWLAEQETQRIDQ